MLLNIPLPRILFFGGKGGVGKTTLAAATAAALAEEGHRTLLVSTDPAHSLGDLLEADLGDDPRQLAANLWGRELDPERARDTYLASVKANIRRFGAPEFMAEAERQVDLSGQHPGVTESALFEALCRQLDEAEDWDRIVVDTAPTGHTLHLLTLPESMQAWTRALLQRQMRRPDSGAPEGEERWRQAREILEQRRALFERTRARLQNGMQSGFMLVVNDDRLSLREGERARAALEKADVRIPAVIVNRVTRAPREALATVAPSFPGLQLVAISAQEPAPQGFHGLLSVMAQVRAPAGHPPGR